MNSSHVSSDDINFVSQSAFKGSGNPSKPLSLLAYALILSLFATPLLRGQQPGINIVLVCLCFAAVSTQLLRSNGLLRSRHTTLLTLSVLFSFGLAWRSSPILQTLALIAMATLLAVAVGDQTGSIIGRLSLTNYFHRICSLAANSLGGFIQLITREIQWQNSAPATRAILASLGGIALALPFVLVFALLFRSADIQFQLFLDKVLNLELILSYSGWVVALTWLSAGILRRLVVTAPPPLNRQSRPALGALELTVAAVTLNVLFATFVSFQVRYLFGGDPVVQLTPGLTYAEYARRGFFELVAAAALLLPLLLVADWCYPEGAPAKSFRSACASLVLLLFVILLSAAKRMHLYQSEFGLTELRFYVSASILLLAFLFIWFGATVLRGKRDRFATGAFTLGLIAVATLHWVNPDAWIARVNLERFSEGKPFDPAYVARELSPDAIPTIVGALPRLPEAVRSEVLVHLTQNPAAETPAWPGWNWSRVRAKNALSSMPE